MIKRKLNRFLYRRGYLRMGDVHDIMDRVGNRLDEIDDKLVQKHGSNAAQKGTLDEKLQAFKLERLDRFFKLVGEETDHQWDRIVDRRASAWFYLIFAVLCGAAITYVLEKL